MEGNLEIASSIDEKDPSKAYDNYCKRILSNKQVVAHIMKECISEYEDVPWEEIPTYIEEPLSNKENEKIIGMNTEDERITGSQIRYDVLFQAVVPNKAGSKDKIGLLINLEAQNKDNPEYPLISRAMYYCSRLLARQKNAPEGFQKSNFQEMKKVYSIWICLNHNEEKENVINRYYFKEECIANEWHSPKEDYDLMQAVMIYPGEHYDYDDDEHGLLEFLNIVFVSNLEAEKKKKILMKDYGIEMTQTLDEEVERMCNLSQGILEKGILKGKKEGDIARLAKDVKALIIKKNMSLDEVFDLLDVDESFKPEIIEILKKDGTI